MRRIALVRYDAAIVQVLSLGFPVQEGLLVSPPMQTKLLDLEVTCDWLDVDMFCEICEWTRG